MASSYIPDEIVDTIRERTDIVEVIADYVALKKIGQNYKALCPFHQEKTPSFTVSSDRQTFHCFGCGIGGNVFQFLMKQENCSFVEAVSLLARRYGIVIPQRQGRGVEKGEGEREELYRLQQLAAEYFHTQLHSSKEGEEGRSYLKRREILGEAIEKFFLGYAPASWDSLLRHCQRKGIASYLLRKSGLFAAKDDGKGLYDRFRRRIIFPIFNLQGRVVAFGGRLLEEKEGKGPKYLNSPETPLYQKGQILYGLNFSREVIRQTRCVAVVEGYFDLIAMYQAGIRNSVATLGTAATKKHALMLKGYANKVILLFDGDIAGISAAERAVSLFLETDLDVQVAPLPAGSDPDAILREEGSEALRGALGGAVPFFDYLLEQAMAGADFSSPNGKRECLNHVLPILGKMRDQIAQMSYLSTLGEKLGIPGEALLAQLRTSRGQKKEEVIDSPRGLHPFEIGERNLIRIMLHASDLIERVRETLSPDDFKHPDHQTIVRSLFTLRDQKIGEVIPKIFDLLPQESQRQLVSSLLLKEKEEEGEDFEGTLNGCLRIMLREQLKPKLAQLKREMQKAEAVGSNDEVKALQKEFLALKDQLRILGHISPYGG